MNKLEEIRERRSKLSSLPWEYKNEMKYDGMWLKDRWIEGIGIMSNYTDDTPEGQEANADCEFVVNAPADIEYLLNEVNRLKNELKVFIDHSCEKMGSNVDVKSYYDHENKETIHYCHYCGETLKKEPTPG
jgi:hypothetical protein